MSFSSPVKEKSIFNFSTFCMITGASKGLGKCIAKTFASKFSKDSLLLLVARSIEHLEKVKLEIQSECGSKSQAANVTVIVSRVDLSSAKDTDYTQLLKRVLREAGRCASDFEQCLIIHNAASLGDVSKKFIEMDSLVDASQYFSLNVASVIALNSRFLQIFPKKVMKQRVVINITSICALQPFKSWSIYCAGKAARDMLFRTMALEDPDIRVLNYAPGPLDTNMQLLARTVTGDDELRDLFDGMHAEGKLLPCELTLKKLVKLLDENTFTSGAHIDYYDLP